MNHPFLKIRLYLTGVVTLAIGALLTWNYFHGGIPSHHILAREDLPEFSNAWGMVLLPLLAWGLSGRVQARISKDSPTPVSGVPARVVYGFFGAMLYGILIAAFFTAGDTETPGYLLIGLVVLSLFFPIYRAECFLGFVLGMTFTFGAVLPTGIGSLFALIGLVMYRGIRPAGLFLLAKIRG